MPFFYERTCHGGAVFYHNVICMDDSLHNFCRCHCTIHDLAAFENSGAIGLTAGHDGSLYRYSAPNQESTDADFDVASRKFKEYIIISGMKKAIGSLSARFEFRLSKL